LTESKPPGFFYGYIVVLLAFLITAIAWGTQYSFGVFFKPVLTEFGWSRAATSGAFSLCVVFNGFLAIFTGRLSDRFGPRVVMTVCGFFLGLGYILMSRMSAIWQLYLFYGIVVGIGLSGVYVPAASTVARWFIKRRGLMTGIAVSGIGLGILVIVPLANWMISSYGWRTSYLIIGILVLVLLILAAQFIRRDPREMGLKPYGESQEESRDVRSGVDGFSLQSAIKTRQFWTLFPMFLCYGFIMSTIKVHIVPHATDLGISPAAAASILSLIGGTSIVGRIVMGSFGERFNNRRATVISLSVLLAALLWLLITKELRMFYLFATAGGFAYGGMAALISLISVELFGLGYIGLIIGVFTFSTTIGEATGPAVAGGIFDTTGSYQLAFLICTALSVITIILASLVKPIVSTKSGATVKLRSPTK